MSLLLDYYGALLTDKQKYYFDLYYNQDLSLGEIAEQEGLSRQGVYDTVSRTEAILLRTEEAVGCIRQARHLREVRTELEAAAQPLLQHPEPAVRQSARRILDAAASLKE